jgi:hypothetical protein
MPQLVLPFREIQSPNSNDAALTAEVWMWVCEDVRRQDDLDAYHKLLFRIDSGSTHTSMGVALARSNNITVPTTSVSRSILTAIGSQTAITRSGLIAVRFVGLEAHLLVLPCTFYDRRPSSVPSLLGLNTLRPRVGPRIRYTFDGWDNRQYSNGRLVIELIPA